jgi:adenine-specific DNA-methyltransferase
VGCSRTGSRTGCPPPCATRSPPARWRSPTPRPSDDQGDEAIDGDGRLRDDIPGKRAAEYRDLWQALQASAQPASADAREAEIYNRLYDFFRRYYEDGDFLSLRRYGADDAYAVPYNGQEVMLHWANRDQYYVKTGEHFTDYRFRAGDKADAWHVEFRLRQAETDRDNTKSADKRHFFFDHGAIELDAEARTLVVPVAWRAATEAEAGNLPARSQQAAINEEAERKLLGKKAVKDQPALLAALKANVAEEGDDPQTLLARHLRRYTRRNTSDFFIHKDLRGFLTRELDYWLKAEVLRLDTLLAGGEQPARAWLQTLACLREVGTTIIEFVARIEDFQKRLYEKRKFVTECHWCLTLDHVERAGLTERLVEILNSTEGGKAQKTEWKKLYAIDEVKAGDGKPGWKDKVTAEFLRSQPFLVLDTVHMPQDFTDALLASLDDIDEATGGLLVHGDNWQALNLLLERYRQQVECVYIDPPYNTGDSEIIYKNNYLHSSWNSLMASRIRLTLEYLPDDAVMFIAIDDFEMVNLSKIVDYECPSLYREMIIVNHHPQGGKAKVMAHTHEYMLVCVTEGSDRTLTGRAVEEGVEHRPFKRSGTAESNYRQWRPNSFYAILVDPRSRRVLGTEPPPALGNSYPTGPTKDGLIRIYPIGANGDERVWRRSFESAQSLVSSGKLVCSDTNTIYQLIEANERTSALFSNWVDPRYNAGTFGANLLRDILGNQNAFSYPKSLYTVTDAIFSSGFDQRPIVLDYFGGSGTTAHAVIHLNREDGGQRKFILVEMGIYFDSVLIPRVKKVAYSADWKDGKPISRQGSTIAFKYVRLESYEDTLSNLRLRADAPGQGGLDLDALPELYRLGYWLDVETAGSASLLDVEKLERPFEYSLSVHDGKATRTKPVDLAETFNYLIGLIVRRRQVLDRDGRRYLLYTGRTRADDVATAVLWRDIAGWGEADFAAERDWIAAQAPFGDATVIYVNGDSAIPGAQSLDPVFHARMFAPVH